MVLPEMILTARYVTPRVKTAKDLFRQQAALIKKNRAAYPYLTWRDPWVSDDKPKVRVDGGRWMISCSTEGCLNGIVIEPEWDGLGCCFECGARYEGLRLPSQATEIERLLVKRRVMSARIWYPGMELEQLAAQNIAMGWEA